MYLMVYIYKISIMCYSGCIVYIRIYVVYESHYDGYSFGWFDDLGHLGEIDAYNLYSAGEKLFDEKNYDEAVKIFKEVQQKYPQSDQAVNSLVNIAAAYMAQEEYRDAGAIFQEVVDNYSDNPKFLPQVDFAKQQLEAMQEARVL